MVAGAARDAAVLDRIVVVHADLGDAEWDGVPPQSTPHTTACDSKSPDVNRPMEQFRPSLIAYNSVGMWPDAARRWCTSDHKRGPIRKVMTRLVADLRASGHDNHRPVHLLNVMGFRAEESPARRRRVPYAATPAASNGRRRVDDWYRSTTGPSPRCGNG